MFNQSTRLQNTPYYHVPDPVFVFPGGNRQATAESMMEMNSGDIINYPNGFVNGTQGSGFETPQGLLDECIRRAQDLATSPYFYVTGSNRDGSRFDPVAAGIMHAALIMESIKRIWAGEFIPGADVSVYDIWISRKPLPVGGLVVNPQVQPPTTVIDPTIVK